VNNLNDLLNASTAILMDQVGRWSAMIQKMRDGRYTPSEWMKDVVGVWDSWLQLMPLPSRLELEPSSGQLPTLLLVMDDVAETVGPVSIPTNLSLPPGVTLEMSDLHQLGGTGVLSKKHVLPLLLPDGRSVEVRLVDLGGGPQPHLARQLPCGIYVGPLYAKELATYRPLALVYVLITHPGCETPTGA
jgi:hypothetical protein